MLKATELYDKRKQRAKDAGTTPDHDGFADWRMCRDYLCLENGASIFMMFYRGMRRDLGHPANYPLLRDVYDIAQLEPFGKQIWDWCSRDLSAVMRQCLNERLADPNYQKETRKQIWAEIGVDIGLADKHRMRA